MPKDRVLLDWLRADRRRAEPMQDQIGRQFRAAILERQLPPGTLLPSSRALAKDLAVSRSTVTAVYDRLLGEGLLRARGRSATFVADGIARQDADVVASGTAAIAENEPEPPSDDRGDVPPPYPAFHPGTPALDIFPVARWTRLLTARCRQMTGELAGEGAHVGGYMPLRAALAEHLRTARGVLCQPEQVVITSSARAALAVACRILTTPGDRCLIEDPGYFVGGRVMANFGMTTTPVPVDANGLVVDPPLPKARLAYITPTHQMPLGVRLADDRSAALIEWARREDAYIIEDDYDSEFRYSGQPVQALQHADPNGRVLHIGTFAKVLFPSLRVAYLVVPRHMATAAVNAIFLNGHEPTLHVQAALSDFISQGHYATHIRRARSVYRRRQGRMIDALNHHLEGLVALSPPAGGMHVVVPLPADIPAAVVQSEAARQSLHVRPLSYYAERAEAPNALHLGFAAVPDHLIEPAVERLAKVIRSVRLD